MQLTVFIKEEDEYLIRKLDSIATRERKSRSSMLMTILEGYLEGSSRLGEILCDLGALSPQNLRRGLDMQKDRSGQLLGEILINEGLTTAGQVQRALNIQQQYRTKELVSSAKS